MSEGVVGPDGLWGNHRLPENGETKRLDIGPLTVWIRAVENELWLAHERAEEDDPNAHPVLPDEPGWSRWALREGQRVVQVMPVFADRPLVLKPEYPFTLMRQAKARVYVRIPVWVRFAVVHPAGGASVTLTEIPTIHLSDTWWGNVREGELAHWLVTKGRRHVTADLFRPHLVMSALQLDNASDDDLQVEKLALRVEHLSIYEKEGALWAEEVRVEYHGEAEGSEIHMDDVPPKEAAGARELSRARHQTRSLKARTFARIKALTPWGG